MAKYSFLTAVFQEAFMSRSAVILLLLLCAVLLGAIQQPVPGSSQAGSSQADMANRAESAQLHRFSSSDEAKALQADIKRMRTLVQQMQQNLAFVDTTQSPLKHQFELEINAWNTIIDQMERRAQTSGK
jgi:hypothetical protein